MQARQLPFIQGATWITQGYALWRRNPALLTFASFSYLLILVMISAVPLIGQPIASLLMPRLRQARGRPAVAPEAPVRERNVAEVDVA